MSDTITRATAHDHRFPTDTITRAAARDHRFPADMTPYRRRQAERYFAAYPRATRVTFIDGWVDRRSLGAPRPHEILHCMATSGRYGKPMKTMLGAQVEGRPRP